MKEKGIAIVACIIMAAVVMYAIVFASSRAQRIRSEQQIITVQLDAEVKKQEEERWRVQEAEADEYYQQKAKLQATIRSQRPRRRSNKNIAENWMSMMVANDCIRNINHEFHEVTIDPVFWAYAPIDSKWQIMDLVHAYFDGYATIVSSTSGRPLASYNAWRGIKIHD